MVIKISNKSVTDLKTVDEIATKYNVDRSTIYRWIEKGLPSIQLVNKGRRIDEEEVEKWLLKQNP